MAHVALINNRSGLGLSIVCYIAITFSTAAACSEVYRCVGAEGKKTFTDKPCQNDSKGSVVPQRAQAVSIQTTSLPALEKLIEESERARKAEDEDFQAGFAAAIGPKCNELFKIVRINANKNLSSAQIRAAENEYDQLGCEAKANIARDKHNKKSEAMWQKELLLREQAVALKATLPKPSARTPECKKLAGQMANILLNSAASDASARMMEEAGKLFRAQKCDQDIMDEAIEENLAAYK